jgi:enamine deaminase RidA (YjgF/YER057c/UK114 family)
VATITPESVATIMPEWVATIARIPQLGSLDKVKRIVKVLGMVNSAPGFTDQLKVINGFSDLMIDVFGDRIGAHARSAVGVAELPLNIPVEIEMVLEVE